MACLRAYNITYARIPEMDEHKASSEPFASVRTSIIGRPKKFCRPWSSVMKRLYISAETCAKLRQVKKAKGFTSDECTIRYLLNCYEEISAIATKDPAATPPPAGSSSSLYTPVMCSTPLTPSRRSPVNTRYGTQLL